MLNWRGLLVWDMGPPQSLKPSFSIAKQDPLFNSPGS